MEKIKQTEWIADMSKGDFWRIDIEADTREEVIKLGIILAKKYNVDEFRIGRQEYCTMSSIDVDTIIEDAQEQLYGEVGEVSETYLENVTNEQYEELDLKLNQVFYEWHKKHNLFPNCFKIIDDEIIKVNNLKDSINEYDFKMGMQCGNCSENKGGKCTRIGSNGEVGICWMQKSEGEY